MSTSALEAKRPVGWAAVPTPLLAVSVSFLTLPERLTVWARVCRSWHAAASSPLSWPESLTLIVHKDRLPSDWQQKRLVEAYGLRVRRLDIKSEPSYEIISCDVLSTLLSGLAPSLLELTVRSAAGCPALPRLEVLRTAYSSTPQLLIELVQRGHFPSLTDLTVGSSSLLGTDLCLCDHLKPLKRLTVSLLALPPKSTPITRLINCPQWTRQVPMLSLSEYSLRDGAWMVRELDHLRGAKVRVEKLFWSLDSQQNNFQQEIPQLLRAMRGLGVAVLNLDKPQGSEMTVGASEAELEALKELRADGLRELRSFLKVKFAAEALALFAERRPA